MSRQTQTGVHVTRNLARAINEQENVPAFSSQKFNDLLNEISQKAHLFKELYQRDGPVTFIGNVYATIDEGIEKMPLEKRMMVRCKKGCSACCHIRVDISSAEARYLLDYCKENNISIDKKYLVAQSKLKNLTQAASPTHSGCVFLKNGECSVYAARPMECRKYFVASDPVFCDTKKYKAVIKNDVVISEPDKSEQPAVVFLPGIEILLSALANLQVMAAKPMAQMLLKFL